MTPINPSRRFNPINGLASTLPREGECPQCHMTFLVTGEQHHEEWCLVPILRKRGAFSLSMEKEVGGGRQKRTERVGLWRKFGLVRG